MVIIRLSKAENVHTVTTDERLTIFKRPALYLVLCLILDTTDAGDNLSFLDTNHTKERKLVERCSHKPFILIATKCKHHIGGRSGVDVWVIKNRALRHGSGVHVPEDVKGKTKNVHPENKCSCVGSTT